jgi:deoxyribonuclease-4
MVAEGLGDDKARYMHCHFSKIEYTDAGEKRHLTFEDAVYGPDFEPLAEAIVREGVCPRIICESAGTMAEDAITMKKLWQQAKGDMI